MRERSPTYKGGGGSKVGRGHIVLRPPYTNHTRIQSSRIASKFVYVLGGWVGGGSSSCQKWLTSISIGSEVPYIHQNRSWWSLRVWGPLNCKFTKRISKINFLAKKVHNKIKVYIMTKNRTFSPTWSVGLFSKAEEANWSSLAKASVFSHIDTHMLLRTFFVITFFTDQNLNMTHSPTSLSFPKSPGNTNRC